MIAWWNFSSSSRREYGSTGNEDEEGGRTLTSELDGLSKTDKEKSPKNLFVKNCVSHPLWQCGKFKENLSKSV